MAAALKPDSGGYAGGRLESRREPTFSDRGYRGGDRGDRPRRRRN